jgi:hypothetical protein
MPSTVRTKGFVFQDGKGFCRREKFGVWSI